MRNKLGKFIALIAIVIVISSNVFYMFSHISYSNFNAFTYVLPFLIGLIKTVCLLILIYCVFFLEKEIEKKYKILILLVPMVLSGLKALYSFLLISIAIGLILNIWFISDAVLNAVTAVFLGIALIKLLDNSLSLRIMLIIAGVISAVYAVTEIIQVLPAGNGIAYLGFIILFILMFSSSCLLVVFLFFKQKNITKLILCTTIVFTIIEKIVFLNIYFYSSHEILNQKLIIIGWIVLLIATLIFKETNTWKTDKEPKVDKIA